MTRSGSSARILIIDDEAAIRDSLKMILEYQGYDGAAGGHRRGRRRRWSNARRRTWCSSTSRCRAWTASRCCSGSRHLTDVTPVVVISGHGTISTAVEATRLGAFDFIEKPLASERVLVIVRNAVDSRRLRTENRTLRKDAGEAAPDHRRQPGAGRGARRHPEGGADQRHRADLGRERRRQGTGGPRHAPREPAPRQPVRAGQLRRHPRRADRVGAVRPREGLVHRRHRSADRQVRAGRQGHDLPRRDRRHEPEDAGQGAARAAGGRTRAARLATACSRSTCG